MAPGKQIEKLHTNCESFIKIGDYACPSMLGAYREWLLIICMEIYAVCTDFYFVRTAY